MYGRLLQPAGRNCIPNTHHLNFKKNGAAVCPLFLSEFTVSENNIGSIILVIVTAHHSATLIMSGNDTACIRPGLSAD